MASHQKRALAYGVSDNFEQELRGAGFDVGSLEDVVAAWITHRRADLWVIGFPSPPAAPTNATLDAILATRPYCPQLLVVPNDDLDRHFDTVSEHARRYPSLVRVSTSQADASSLRLQLKLLRELDRPLLLSIESFNLGELDMEVWGDAGELHWRGVRIEMTTAQVRTLALLVKADGRAAGPAHLVRVAYRPDRDA